MRDAHRIKEKINLSLDTRQVLSLLVGALVLLAAAFGTGVMVGRKGSASTHPVATPDPLTSLDQKAAALDQARHDPPLTFQDELTRKMPEPPAPKPVVIPQIRAPIVSVDPDAMLRPDSGSAATVPAQAHVPPPEPKLASAEDSTDGTAIPTRTASAPAATPEAKHPTPPSEATPGGAFTLQLGASPNKDDADRQVARLRDRGYAPYIVKAQLPGKGTFYRVRMGSFATKDAAQHFLEDFKRETQLEAYVASTK